MRRAVLIAIGLAASAPAAVVADGAGAAAYPPFALERTQQRPLEASVNNQHYLLSVGLPPSYGMETQRRYPVVYLLDGYWDFPALYHMQGGLLFDKVIPEHILVGIGYQREEGSYDRMRAWDLTPVPDGDGRMARSGGGPAFLKLIESEVIPLVKRDYRVDASYRVLAGSSLGGLFTLYAMLERPTLFQAGIASSPAVSFARDWLFGREEALVRAGTPLPATLFVTAGEAEWPELVAAIRRFDAQLRARTPAGLRYQFRLIDGEAHAGSKPEAFNRGLRAALKPYLDRRAAGQPPQR